MKNKSQSIGSQTNSSTGRGSYKKLWIDEIILIGGMMVLAGCGLIYEYLIADYAGRIIGAVDTAIYAIIGTMIVAMGVGSFLAKLIDCPYRGFAWLELGIGILGSSAILIMAAIVSFAFQLPEQLQTVYGIHPTITTNGGVVKFAQQLTLVTPFIVGFILGAMIGVEIPLIARIREKEYNQHLVHNTGTIYGADYIGAGIGAAIWVLICLQFPAINAAIATAAANSLIGVIFLLRYQDKITSKVFLWLGHLGLLVLLLILFLYGERAVDKLNSALFKDEVIYQATTPYQNLTLTKRVAKDGSHSVINLFINGRLQFSSSDEKLYHSYLTTPALLAAAQHKNILLIGGGDGLALRDLLKANPDRVTIIELDKKMIELFSTHPKLTKLNQNAFKDPRVDKIIGDAFLEVETLLNKQHYFDLIVVDLPDPSHPNLNKLYSDYFYSKLYKLLTGDGAITIQSTSPYHARNAFISIGKTVASVGFITEQYHANIPSFGEWGWTIANKPTRSSNKKPSTRIMNNRIFDMANSFLSKQNIAAAFVFYPSYYSDSDQIKINQLGSHQLYKYHHESWVEQDSFALP